MHWDGKLPLNWFDFALLGILVIGLQRGRKRGMSEEFMSVSNWVVVVLAGALAYQPLGKLMANATPISLLTCNIICYLAVAGVVALIFVLIKKSLGGKLIGSDTFGSSEYYLGMPAGMLRFICITFVFLAILNARLYKPNEIADMKKFQDDNYGSEFFPTLHTLQASVFEKSFAGPPIKKYLGFLLIEPVPAEEKQLVRARERTYP